MAKDSNHFTNFDLNIKWEFYPEFVSLENLHKRDISWKSIEVPGEWVMQGYVVKKNHYATYSTKFLIPLDWEGRRVILRFEGVYSDAKIAVNGVEIGNHTGGFTCFEFDITDFVDFQPGKENSLVVWVKNESLADKLASATSYACHPLGGINRKVTIFAVPNIHISDLRITTELIDNSGDGVLSITGSINNLIEGKTEGVNLLFEIFPWKKELDVVADVQLGSQTPEYTTQIPVYRRSTARSGDTITFKSDLQCRGVNYWDCENPHLYILKCTVSAFRGEKLEIVTVRFGFRSIKVKGDLLLINNRPVKLRGVNRHEVHPTKGRSLTDNQWKKDVQLFLAANINHIRTCHYPPCKELLDAADEYGVFVEVEAPFCWSMKVQGRRKKVLESTLSQTLEMVKWYQNHPSIIMWSVANESIWNKIYAKSAQLIKKYDSTRPLVFNTWYAKVKYAKPDEKDCEIANLHYPGLSGPEIAKNYKKRPLYFGEYCHINAYNRFELATDQTLRDQWGKYFQRLWEAIYHTEGSLGGSIWVGIDDTFFHPNGTILGYGTWGILDGWRREKPEYWHTLKVYSPIQITTTPKLIDPTHIELEIENRQHYSNLNRYSVVWSNGSYSGEMKLDLKPQAKANLALEFPVTLNPQKPLTLLFEDPRGFSANKFEFLLNSLQEESNPQSPIDSTVPFKLINHPDSYIVKQSGMEQMISKASGLFQSVTIDNDSFPLDGPYLMLLPMNSDGVTKMKGKPLVYPPTNEYCQNWVLTSIEQGLEGSQIQLIVKGSNDNAEGEFRYRFTTNGKCELFYQFILKTSVKPRQIGVVLKLPKEFDTLSWRRKGLWNTYPENHIGRLEGGISAKEGVECTLVGPREQPEIDWRMDRGIASNHDFSSTKHNISFASLLNEKKQGFVIRANNDVHSRCWQTEDATYLLIASYSNGGSERFLRVMTERDDKNLKTGEKISGSFTWELVCGKK